MSSRLGIFRSDSEKTPIPQRPHFLRVMGIVQDHIGHARLHPADPEALARRLGVSLDAAIAFVITDEITEVFSLMEQGD